MNLKKIAVTLASVMLLSTGVQAKEQRLVAIGGSITEVICALGHCQDIVAADATSVYPSDLLERVPNLGYYRQLSAEGVVKQKADRIFMIDSAGPIKEVEKLKSLGIPIETLSSKKTVEAAEDRILKLGAKLNKADQARELIKQMKSDLSRAKVKAKTIRPGVKILFIYSRGRDRMMVAGRDTGPDEMFRILGLKNAFPGKGFKPVSGEAIMKLNPDVIVFPENSKEKMTVQEIQQMIPGIKYTAAAKQKRILFIDDLKFLGFTHRLGEAALDLIRGLESLQWRS
ncbi:heme/hemin ABC transporter substrate-binding protein [Pseudobacteriovorax antillogorgiicola]|uniref:Iron complex transport system substrate-binding protein n=1 Tax=Pseudobacteriovorax antillogorgiicola TaxID=1513793 RepID=A0A1Y6CH19_9BACT|nr:ABC transporter substrate-binding protein [Pseudobacteriovorax antillogorgiicola]TCS49028.1 iron complex transport system substrate-binding protein [Pseudobacteriovorax antillogorgiicola]SMF52814.1 iron complex transport system substrate-binding protein [Pseudobacteriovorax antillogorgiicola]